MTIDRLMSNYRAALVALVESADAVGLPWRDGDAYDAWDAVASALFHGLVELPILDGLASGGVSDLRVAPYDMLLPAYVGYGVIEVVSGDADEDLRVFHAFATTAEPFDTVSIRRLGRDGAPTAAPLEMAPINDTRFQLRVLSATQQEDVVLREMRLLGNE